MKRNSVSKGREKKKISPSGKKKKKQLKFFEKICGTKWNERTVQIHVGEFSNQTGWLSHLYYAGFIRAQLNSDVHSAGEWTIKSRCENTPSPSYRSRVRRNNKKRNKELVRW
jgi:hypothetical protein